MQNNKVFSFVKFVFTRVIILYLLFYAFSLVIVDYKKIHDRIIIRTLNDNMPTDFSYFLRLGEGAGTIEVEKDQLARYSNYYEKVVKYIPKLPEAHGMLGFSYFYLGKEEEAIASIGKAAVLDSYFFWYQYNLGVIYYQKGDYKKAIQFFENAVSKKPEIALIIINRSSVYQRALRGATNLQDIMLARIKSGYSESYRLIVLSHMKSRNYPEMIKTASSAIALGLEHKELFYYYLGVGSYHLNEFQKSLYFLQEAIKRDPQFAEAFYYLSLNLKALGQDEVASQTLARSFHLHRQVKSNRPKEDKSYLRIF